MSTAPSDIWHQIDRAARVECCYASQGQACQGFHPQGTRVVFGYEALSKSVQGALHATGNRVLDEAIGEISQLVTKDGMILKSNVLEILSGLKLANA